MSERDRHRRIRIDIDMRIVGKRQRLALADLGRVLLALRRHVRCVVITARQKQRGGGISGDRGDAPARRNAPARLGGGARIGKGGLPQHDHLRLRGMLADHIPRRRDAGESVGMARVFIQPLAEFALDGRMRFALRLAQAAEPVRRQILRIGRPQRDVARARHGRFTVLARCASALVMCCSTALTEMP